MRRLQQRSAGTEIPTPRHPALVALVWLTIAAWGAVRLEAAAGLRPQDIQQGYREALSALASGEEERALEQLFQVETRALGSYPGVRTIERLWRLKLGVVRELLETSPPEIMVPIVVFHHQAYLMYRDRGEALAAHHARQMAAELAEHYARLAGDTESGLFAGWVLTSFGSYLQESRSVSQSALYFQRALEASPGNEAALMGLASCHEKTGEYEPAAQALWKAIRLNPDNSQARLRLGLCRKRLGHPELAIGVLEPLLEERHPDWVRSVAYQELARIHLARAEDDQAERLLRDALDLLPGDQEPALLLAALLERRGELREASRLLSRLEPVDSGRSSARYIYDTWPRDGIDEARATLLAMMSDRLDLLATGLADRAAASGEGEEPPREAGR